MKRFSKILSAFLAVLFVFSSCLTVCAKSDDTSVAYCEHTYVTQKATNKKDGCVKCSKCGSIKSKIYKISSIKLSKTYYTYDGKTKKPSVTVKDSKGNKISSKYYTVTYPSGRKKAGKYAVKIKFKGKYNCTSTKNFVIRPKSTSISKITAGNGSFKVYWKKQKSQTTGYQIQYSKNKNMKNAKTVTVKDNTRTSKNIKNLSGKKKYYVRVRTYKSVKFNGKKINVYSKWSKKQQSTTKHVHSRVGNCGKWYDSYEDFYNDYMSVSNTYSSMWHTGEISAEEYFSKCPSGYKVWKCNACIGCNKWTGDYYYRN